MFIVKCPQNAGEELQAIVCDPKGRFLPYDFKL